MHIGSSADNQSLIAQFDLNPDTVFSNDHRLTGNFSAGHDGNKQLFKGFEFLTCKQSRHRHTLEFILGIPGHSGSGIVGIEQPCIAMGDKDGIPGPFKQNLVTLLTFPKSIFGFFPDFNIFSEFFVDSGQFPCSLPYSDFKIFSYLEQFKLIFPLGRKAGYGLKDFIDPIGFVQIE